MTSADELAIGVEVEVEVGPVAHGGHCVARHDGRVLFVRHALPGERVRARVTEDSGRFLRADAVEVLDAAAGRVEAPCPLAHPGGCGGCDFQHASPASQRDLKAAVVREQLQRLAGLDREVVVEAVPGDEQGLRWRTRMQYVALPDGRRGLRKHRSHDVVEVTDCPIAHPDARVQVVQRTAEQDRRGKTLTRVLEGDADAVTEHVETDRGGRDFTVAGDGFWQVHPGAPRTLTETVLAFLSPRAGDRVLDLYAGVGLFAAHLAEVVGAAGSVLAVEGDRQAAAYARQNLADLPWAEVACSRVDRVLAGGGITADVVVLDPPRQGAKRPVVRGIAATGARAVAYVACDPAALARDVAYFAEEGYTLVDLRALDLFPMTHHVECVALLTRD